MRDFFLNYTICIKLNLLKIIEYFCIFCWIVGTGHFNYTLFSLYILTGAEMLMHLCSPFIYVVMFFELESFKSFIQNIVKNIAMLLNG